MIKKFFLAILSVFFPWLVLLIEDNPGGALVALIMQASIIGWLPATIWAWRTATESSRAEKRARKASRKAGSQEENNEQGG